MLITLQKKIIIKPQYIKPNTKTQIDNCLKANTITGTKNKKTRSTKRYSTKKLTPQKGSGKARKGSRSSPVLVGGSKAFIDTKNNTKKKINKKMYQKYLKYCLYNKYIHQQIKLIKQPTKPKTTSIAHQLCNYTNKTTIILITCTHTQSLERATRNIAPIYLTNNNTINPILINKSNLILLTYQCYKPFFKKRFNNEITFI
ncbi:50S ribosomal protein L4 [Candidatus Vidania fulgoroideae]|uniref:Large ribosomal subunit protein uL4 n=1 Tax=Candidatus Vidania fulgoroideorum TaxID=881286 RepID=A0A974XDP3_9PROT|nr:50S ribosomal protein L4 [Candidatus Vidania fulgoroideae]